jgi:hypothetical protein
LVAGDFATLSEMETWNFDDLMRANAVFDWKNASDEAAIADIPKPTR